MPTRWPRDGAAMAGKPPVFEYVMTGDEESFLWRLDDYPWERNVWNIHPEYEVHLVRNAAGIALIGDYIGSFGPGHLSIVGSNLPHDWVSATAPGEIIAGRDIVLQFDPDRLRRAAALFPELSGVEPFLARALRGLAFHGETRRRGAELLEAIGEAHGLDRLALFLRLIGGLAASGEYEVLSSEGFVPRLDPGALGLAERVLIYVHDNFTRDIRLADLAAMTGMSESTVSRFFKRNSGNSFTDHVAKLRIGRACKLLADTTMPVTDICFEVGYANLSNFNRLFRRYRGTTPSGYRRLTRQRLR